MKKPTMARTAKRAREHRKIGRYISLPVRIMATAKQIQVMAWVCLTMEKDSRQPSLILAQLTLSQLVRQLITKPQLIPTTSGKNMVTGSTMQLMKVRQMAPMSTPSPDLPTLITANLSLRKALSMAPKMQPTPSAISRKPTLMLVRMSMWMSLLMQVLMNPLTNPSRMIIRNIQDIFGQYRIERKKTVFICCHAASFTFSSTATATTDVLPSLSKDSPCFQGCSSRLSRKRVQTSHETKLSAVSMVKQMELPKQPSPKVVTSAPNKLLPYTIPLVIPKYLPSSFFGILQRLNNFIRQPP